MLNRNDKRRLSGSEMARRDEVILGRVPRQTLRADIVASGDLDVMEIEHYPGMTECALTKIAEEARARWSLGAEAALASRRTPRDASERPARRTRDLIRRRRARPR